MKRHVRKLSIRFQILIPAGLLALVICVLLGWNTYMRIETGMVAMGVQQAEMAANIARSSIDGDLLRSIGKGSEGSQEYETLLAGLRQTQKICGIAYLYTLYTDGEGGLFYGIDTDTSAAQLSPGDPAGMSYSEFADTFAGSPYVQDYIDRTSDGNLISAYLPIYDSAGEIVGILGCDYEASYVMDRMGAAVRSTIQISAIMFVAAILILNMIAAKLMRRLRKVDTKIYDLVHNEGDLTQKLDIRSGDELELIADNVNALLEYMHRIMLQISFNSEQLETSTESVVNSLAQARDSISDVSSTMEEMSAAMEETSASLWQVNESVTEIDNTVGSIAERATHEGQISSETAQKVQETYNRAEADRAEAGRQAEKMSVAVNEKIERSKAVKQIEALTEEIINITDQTSLLALNANIEAARAGEAGRGFAVVAGEIGALAGNTNEAANEIQKMSKEVVEAIQGLGALADKMLHFLENEISGDYQKFGGLSHGFAQKSDEIRTSMEQLLKNMEEYAGVLEKIRMAMESVGGASEENNAEIIQLSERLEAIDEEMKSIETTAEDTFSAISVMNGELSGYRV